MRMSVGTRILFSLFLLIIIAASVLIILAAFDVIPGDVVLGLAQGFAKTWYRYIWAGAALVLLILAVSLMFFGAGKPEPQAVSLNTGTDGSVDITLEAVKELAEAYLRDVNGVIVQRILPHATGYRSVALEIYLSVRQETAIQAVTEQISSEIREHIEKYAGLMTSHVGIKVLPMKQVQQYPSK